MLPPEGIFDNNYLSSFLCGLLSEVKLYADLYIVFTGLVSGRKHMAKFHAFTIDALSWRFYHTYFRFLCITAVYGTCSSPRGLSCLLLKLLLLQHTAMLTTP